VVASRFSICTSREFSPRCLLSQILIFYRYGPHKCAKVLHSAFCEIIPQSTPRSATEAQTPGIGLPNLASTINHHTHPGSKAGTPNPDVEAPKLATKVDFDPPEKSKLNSSNGIAKKDFEPDPTDFLSPRTQAFPLPQKFASPINEPSPSSPKEKQMRVLLVEDNEINLKLLVATMRKLKIIHTTAMNGLEALNAYKECRGQFDVVLMDISMPVMSGIDSAKYIRRFEKDEKLAATKLIALTGAANPTTRQDAFNVGVDLYLTKPVPMRELRGLLEEIKGESAFEGLVGK
jgi:CheY-like chemotaxis protein